MQGIVEVQRFLSFFTHPSRRHVLNVTREQAPAAHLLPCILLTFHSFAIILVPRCFTCRPCLPSSSYQRITCFKEEGRKREKAREREKYISTLEKNKGIEKGIGKRKRKTQKRLDGVAVAVTQLRPRLICLKYTAPLVEVLLMATRPPPPLKASFPHAIPLQHDPFYDTGCLILYLCVNRVGHPSSRPYLPTTPVSNRFSGFPEEFADKVRFDNGVILK